MNFRFKTLGELVSEFGVEWRVQDYCGSDLAYGFLGHPLPIVSMENWRDVVSNMKTHSKGYSKVFYIKGYPNEAISYKLLTAV